MADRSILTISFKKRHLFALLIIVLSIIFGYSVYFKAFMTLPQSSINLVQSLPYDLTGKKILVLSPHCDDETLGDFGVIDRVIAGGGEAKVVMVTDCNHKGNGQARKAETVSAMAIAGLDKSNIEFLDFAEAKDERSKDEVDRLHKSIGDIMDSFNPDFVFAPHPSDTHQDHKFVGQSAEIVFKQRNESAKAIYYLVHYNFLKFPSPPGMRPDSYLLPPARLVNLTDKWYKFDLTQDEEYQKEEAVLKYKTQLRKSNPVLRRVLFDFIRKNELFMVRSGG